MKLKNMKKIWNKVKLHFFAKKRKLEKDEINWDLEFLPRPEWQQPSMNDPENYWKLESLITKAKLNAVLSAFKDINKECYIKGNYEYGYYVELKDRKNEITKSK